MQPTDDVIHIGLLNNALSVPGLADVPIKEVKAVTPNKSFANPKRRNDLPGQTLFFGESDKIVDADGKDVSSMSWMKYLKLRPSTCKPRLVDSTAVFDARPEIGDPHWDIARLVREEQLLDLTQATLEFIGEVAELASLFMQHGFKCLYGDPRKQLIDECGDILFTGSWALDAWCRNTIPEVPEVGETLDRTWARAMANPMIEMDDTELFRVTDSDPHAIVAATIVASGGMKLAKDRQFVGLCEGYLGMYTSTAMMMSGLTANSLKKLQFQRREQSIVEQIDRIMQVFMAVNAILILANSSIEEAMIVNRAKLDKRYPGGYKSGQGGGIRTES